MSRARAVADTDHGSVPNCLAVYVMRSLDLYKIGKSEDVEQRLREFRVGNPHIEFVAAVADPGADVVERRLHEHFAACRKGGEWFERTDDLETWVTHLCSSPHTATRIADIPQSLPLGVYPWDSQTPRVDETGQTVLPIATRYQAPIGSGTGQTSSISEDWYTPKKYVDAAREVFGGTIDLDPMSCMEANRTVQATRFLTAEVDGLTFEWHGNVFLNPPWGQGPNNAKVRAVRKAMVEYDAGRASAVILVLNANAITAGWFARLLATCQAIAVPNHRVSHYGPGGKGGAPNTGTVFVYLGKCVERFSQVFQRFGTVLSPVASGGADLIENENGEDDE